MRERGSAACKCVSVGVAVRVAATFFASHRIPHNGFALLIGLGEPRTVGPTTPVEWLPEPQGGGQGRAVPPSLTLLSSSIFTFFWEMLFWILLLKLALPAARPHRSPSSRRQHSCPGPGPAAPGGPAAETAPAPGTSVPAPVPAPFPAEAAAAAAATTAATAAAASPPRLISSGVKPFMTPRSGTPALTEIPARRAAPPLSGDSGVLAGSLRHLPQRRQFAPHPKFSGGTAKHQTSSACCCLLAPGHCPGLGVENQSRAAPGAGTQLSVTWRLFSSWTAASPPPSGPWACASAVSPLPSRPFHSTARHDGNCSTLLGSHSKFCPDPAPRGWGNYY